MTLVLEEMTSRTLYLILTRPVARAIFIIGRFLGLIGIMTCAFLFMAAEHATRLAVVHVPLDLHYALSLFFSWEKIVVITAVALVFSLIFDLDRVGPHLHVLFWIMGHFSTELLSHCANKASQPALMVVCKLFYYLFPNFQVMNIRDIPPDVYNAGWLWSAGGYGLSYTFACLSLTALVVP